MTEITPRFGMPLLASGQSQKEATHNEALTLADALIGTVVEAVAPTSIPAAPQPGHAWVVGAAPTGVWVGQANNLAIWSVGGWRFVSVPEGMMIWSVTDSLPAQRVASGWQIGQLNASQLRIGGHQLVGPRLASISAPTAGATVDTEARTVIDAILERLRTHGLIAT